MTPVKTDRSNFVMYGPTLDIADIWVELDPANRMTWIDWLPTDAEREALAAGALLRLGIMAMPMPPVQLQVRPDLRVVDVTAPVPREGR